MTEAEWLACENPLKMLAFVRVSERKLRLFACACVWEYLRVMCPPHCDWGRMPSAVLLSERYADSLVTRDDWLKGTREGFHFPPWKGEDARQEAAYAFESAEAVADSKLDESRRLANFLRCISGTPFSPASFVPSWRTPTTTALAQAAYEERRLPECTLHPARLAVLSDALEEAGCTDEDLLAHLRAPSPHVRGCWAIDLLLGKS